MTFPLKDRHPSLFYLLLLKAAVNFVLAGFLAFGDPLITIAYRRAPDHSPIPLWFWSILFSIIACGFLYGSLTRNIRWARRALIWQTYVGAFWAFGFWMALMNGAIFGISAPVLWTLYTLNCVILAGEPSINPASEKNNGRDTA